MSILSPFSLVGKTLIVTGASSGIGRQCAISCARLGASVAVFGRDPERLNETLGSMDEPGKHMVCAVDLLEYDKVGDIVREIVRQKGRIEGLINCAGISTTLPINSLSTHKMEYFMQTNVFASVNITRHTVKSVNFSQEGGSVIFISSVMGVTGENGKTLYSMTKGALVAAVKSMALELAPRKIRVNSISPGVVESPMSRSAVYSSDEESLNKIKSHHPLGLGQVDDVANACIFLLSDASRWITGTNLIVDGGYLAK
ncbi:MAG TPA: SDR family oxidoreductase [Bacteroidales bacterium]|nr:SDR family oxidoreductase [Bacteroidales bacterium]